MPHPLECLNNKNAVGDVVNDDHHQLLTNRPDKLLNKINTGLVFLKLIHVCACGFLYDKAAAEEHTIDTVQRSRSVYSVFLSVCGCWNSVLIFF